MYRMGQEEINAVARVIESGQLFKVNSGTLQESYNFEKELKDKVGVDHTILMTSGHAGLTAALIGMGIGPGDEVIVPAYTYIATAMAVVAAGAVPVIAEIDETLMLDPKDVEKKITKKTKAVIPVHMQGNPCDMDAFVALGKKYGIAVLEDACQAVGGQYKGKYLGTLGDAGAFSFNYFKVISAGEGGALLTNNKSIFEKALIYHDSSAVAYFGNQMEDFSTETFCGHEFRTNEITAAILREQLKKLDGIINDLREKKNMLRDALAPHFKFIPSNDYDGCCATSLTLQFDSAEEAEKIAKNSKACTVPINTGKHVYTAWDCILNKRGAAHPLFNPFNFEANKGYEYDPACCEKSLELLKKAGHISINPDWTKEQIDAIVKRLVDAKNA
ncbi:MAG: aminotransferase class V-fold PLP-dependent enzyme [Clostridia bacterium]|nr:aminotransferase class V-fold PLP-dependent enzyme [Clostridia bacterium]